MFRLLALLLILGATPAQAADDCPALLHLKGYLSHAEARCGFKEQAAPDHAAHVCASRLGDTANPMMIDGLRFANGEEIVKGGTTAWCAFVRQTLPSLIER